MRYCIWNNKGGVGKTFLTYCLAVEYAIQHPEKTVVVADMCPQTNISGMLLGGNGKGEENLDTLYKNKFTIAEYIKLRRYNGQALRTGTEINYFKKIHDYNDKMPENLYLLPGDVELDACSLIIDYIAQDPSVPDAWIRSRNFLTDLIDVFEADQKAKEKEITLFIDSNPSFANYTQMNIIASDRLIIPCTADSASKRGVENMFRLVYGIKIDNAHGDDIFFAFHNKIAQLDRPLPKVHTFVLNKSRTIDENATAAYTAHANAIKKMANDLAVRYRDTFTGVASANKMLTLKDCNTIAPVVDYNGERISALHQGRYRVYDNNAVVNKQQIDTFKSDLNSILAII
jgi:cellulose biosynthesis protein BcsQ